MNKKAIGVFDSGIGGLTVYKAIKELMPTEKVIYLGDTAHVPYGTKSAETIVRFSEENSRFLTQKGVKIIVIACNSSSSYAVAHLQDLLDIPVLGVIDPGSEAAAQKEGLIGVIGTAATISSGAYDRSILEKNRGAKIVSSSCPLFVPLVEEGWINHPVTDQVIREYLLPLKKKGVKTLVLGCTHYPLLKEAIGRVLGDEIELIDSAEVMALRVQSILKKLGWLNGHREGNGEDEFYVTDFPERFKRVGEIFLQRKIDKVEMVTL